MITKQNFQWFPLVGKMTFFAPDGGGGEGGATAILGEPEMEEPVADAGVIDDVVEEPVKKDFNPEEFAAKFGETFAKTFHENTPKKDEPKKELSPEESKKLLNVWEPSDEWYAKYDNLDTRKDAVAEQRDALIKQADTITQIRLQQRFDELDKKYAPIVEHMQRVEAQQQETRFHTTYPDLAKPELRPMIVAVVQSLAAEGKSFAGDEKAGFKAIAERVEQVIRASGNTNFKLSAPVAQKKSGGEIPVTSPGAGGGGGGSSKPTTSGKGRALSILGDVIGG